MPTIREDRDPRMMFVAGLTAGAVVGLGAWSALVLLGHKLPDLPPLPALVGLARQGPPVVTALAFTITYAAAGAVILWISASRRRHHDQQVREQADLDGFTFHGDAKKDDFPDLTLFRDWDSGINRATGRVKDVPVEILDFTSRAVWKDDTGEEHGYSLDRTIVLIPAPRVPGFHLQSKRFLDRVPSRPTDFPGRLVEPGELQGDEPLKRAFRKAYELRETGFTEEQTLFPADVFTPDVMERLLGWTGWSIRSEKGYLAFWRGTRFRSAAERGALVGEAMMIRDVLERESRRRASTTRGGA